MRSPGRAAASAVLSSAGVVTGTTRSVAISQGRTTGTVTGAVTAVTGAVTAVTVVVVVVAGRGLASAAWAVPTTRPARSGARTRVKVEGRMTGRIRSERTHVEAFRPIWPENGPSGPAD